VRGFAKDKIVETNIKKIDNDEFATTTELYSLYLAMKEIKENTVISYGDILFKSYILNDLLNDNNNITIIVDADYVKGDDYHEYVKADTPYSESSFRKQLNWKKYLQT